MSSTRIATLEDDLDQGQMIKQVLAFAGYDCHLFSDGKLMLRQLRRESYDLIVLTWQLPDLSAPEIVRWVRTNLEHRIPILFLTERHDERQVVDCLGSGADDYMIKPIRRGELMARVNALMRRAYPKLPEESFEAGVYTVDTRVREVQLYRQPIDLTQKEYELALFFFRNVGRLLSRRHMLESVWGKEHISTRTIDTHVSRLRSKLMIGPKHGFRLVSVYSLGYRLEVAGEVLRQPIVQHRLAF
jgi:DNA-binding response OmpR family regulator